MASSGSLVRASSDVINDFTCMPCLDDGKNTEALFQCVDCQTYYCQKCVSNHNKFVKNHTVLDEAAMKNYTVLDEAAMKSGHEQTERPDSSLTVLTEICDQHPGEVIKMYCEQHDIVCCSVCVAVKHRPCTGVEYIPSIASKLLRSKDRGKTKTNLEKIKTELQRLKSDRLIFLQDMKQHEDNIVEDIQNCKKRLQSRLEELEESSVSEVKTKFKEVVDDVNGDIENVNKMLKDVELHLRNCTHTKDDDTQLFVNIKIMEMQSLKGEDCAKEVRKTPVETVDYRLSNSIEDWLQDVKSLGSLKVSKHILSPLVNILYLTGQPVLSSFASYLQRHLAVNGITSYFIKLDELDADLYTVAVCNAETADNSLKNIKEEFQKKIILVPLAERDQNASNMHVQVQRMKLLQALKNRVAGIEYVSYRRLGNPSTDEESCIRVINLIENVIHE